MLKSVVQVGPEAEGDANHGLSTDDHRSLRRKYSTSSQALGASEDDFADHVDTSIPSHQSRRTNSIYVTPFLSTVKAKSATSIDITESLFSAPEETGIIQGTVELDGDLLVQLTRQRPELAEFLALEIRNMKIRQAESTTR